ncbi:MAG: DNA repair protein RecO [Alphaproteobacteria bacterium]|nr:DNA repair protein RecO [Alphaproteobacteria bacterium]
MEWVSEGFIISVREHGDNQAVINIFTEKYGRCQGLLYGRQNKRNIPTMQVGNLVQATWKARIENQLGYFLLEIQQDNSCHIFSNYWASYIISAAAELIYRLFPERESHVRTYKHLLQLFPLLSKSLMHAIQEYVKWETVVLADIGYGLNLSNCAVTGQSYDLSYVSPKTGRAVSESVAQNWVNKLLILPDFLQVSDEKSLSEATESTSIIELLHGLNLTGFFIEKYAMAQLSTTLSLQARSRLINVVNTAIKQHKERSVTKVGIST